MRVARVLFWGVVYATIVVGAVVVGAGGPAFIYQGF